MPPSDWQPLLEGRARRRALEIVERIAGAAAGAVTDWDQRTDDSTGLNSVSLACGRAGAALFYAYRASAVGADDSPAVELLDGAITAAAEKSLDSSLYCGFAGIAFVTEHLNRMASGGAASAEPDEDPNADIDALLGDALAEPRPDAEYDLIDGLVGVGVYGLERLPLVGGRRIVELVVARLAELARPQVAGVSWPTPPRRRAWRESGKGAADDINVGVAHGVPGIIAFLGRAVGAGVAVETARPLLEGGVAWLLRQKLPAVQLSCFPNFVGMETEPTPARCAWCYGDPGIAATLLNAARGADMPAWADEALAIARFSAKRREERMDVRDAGLCHGAAGVAHAFNRMYQATGDGVLAEAARYWFERAIAMNTPGGGLAGYQTWSLERTLDGEWIDDPRFLTGVCGTGLALLAASTPLAPDWDRVMLLDVPPRREAGARR